MSGWPKCVDEATGCCPDHGRQTTAADTGIEKVQMGDTRKLKGECCQIGPIVILQREITKQGEFALG